VVAPTPADEETADDDADAADAEDADADECAATDEPPPHTSEDAAADDADAELLLESATLHASQPASTPWTHWPPTQLNVVSQSLSPLQVNPMVALLGQPKTQPRTAGSHARRMRCTLASARRVSHVPPRT